jgi:proteasome lid subunit RPN8/RPN11|tara:strand:- start:17 stop:364 length:348 start_codon:yes stop_codon:yes gene_type:complete
MKEYKWAKDAFKHARKVYPEECCGLIIKVDNEEIYWKCNNIAKAYKEKSFVIDPLDYARGEDQGEVLGIVHNHPDGELAFSHTDRMACKYIDLPFYLVEPNSESIIVIYPSEIND